MKYAFGFLLGGVVAYFATSWAIGEYLLVPIGQELQKCREAAAKSNSEDSDGFLGDKSAEETVSDLLTATTGARS